MESINKEILIDNNNRVKDIQQEFSACYPFLKIDFFVTGIGSKRRAAKLVDPCTSLKKLAGINLRKIDINKNRTVAEVSGDFRDALGVIAEVSRKSGNIWNTISISDGWTLQSQNIAGEFICSEMAKNEVEPLA
ncbi:MAG: hypothetical protein ABI416_16845 [Ginsengibacter sp.]